jgi:hypothetical protein
MDEIVPVLIMGPIAMALMLVIVFTAIYVLIGIPIVLLSKIFKEENKNKVDQKYVERLDKFKRFLRDLYELKAQLFRENIKLPEENVKVAFAMRDTIKETIIKHYKRVEFSDNFIDKMAIVIFGKDPAYYEDAVEWENWVNWTELQNKWRRRK